MDNQDNKEKIKILMVCPEFPPVISPAAIRMWGVCKGLEKHGFQPVVLTQIASKNSMIAEWIELPSSHWSGKLSENYSETSLMSISSGKSRKNEKTRFQSTLNTLIPMEPATTLSLGRLIRKSKSLHAVHDFSLVFVTSNPVANAIGGVLLKRKLKCPVVVELRDPWTQNPLRTWPTKIHYLVEQWLESKVVRDSDHLIMNTPTARNNLLKKYSNKNRNTVHVISHGYDAERFQKTENEVTKPQDELVIGYIGGFYMEPTKDGDENIIKKILASVKEAVRFSNLSKVQRKDSESSPETIFKAVQELSIKDSELSKSIKFRFTGASAYQIFPLAEKYGISGQIELFPKVKPSMVINEFQECDLLFLTNPRLKNSPFIGTKTVEYLASGKLILAELPKGDQAYLLAKSGVGWRCDSGDVECLKGRLVEASQAKRNPSNDNKRNDEYIEKLERKWQVNDLVTIFNQSLNTSSPATVISEVYI